MEKDIITWKDLINVLTKAEKFVSNEKFDEHENDLLKLQNKLDTLLCDAIKVACDIEIPAIEAQIKALRAQVEEMEADKTNH